MHHNCRYVNQPEPELKGASVTIKATEDKVEQMQKEADQIWPPELAQLMRVGPPLQLSGGLPVSCPMGLLCQSSVC